MKKKVLYIGAAIVVLALGYWGFKSYQAAEQTFEFETAKIAKGTISSTITATGTIEAIKTVAVGTQVSGVITKIFVDFNSQVKKGQLLAQIDETPLIAQLDQSKSTVDQADAQLKYQKATYDRYKILIGKKLIAQSDFDLAEYNYNNAKAALSNAKTGYDRSKINLSYARIYSPIDGIILNRAVDEGQTVAASFNTPTLFSIANDLTRMQVQANIDEADIGQIKLNQRVEFSVDAYPDQKFAGAVTEIRIQPVVTSNVVTYTVIIQASNPDLKLMPGMTANISIFVNEKKDILVVPGKALRFTPDEVIYTSYLKTLSEDDVKMMAPQIYKGESPRKDKNFVWIKNGNVIHKKEVKIGSNDGINYELISGANEGDEIVSSLTIQKASAEKKTAAKSPFMPQRPGQRR
jgi:HlyD family secretion protein